MEPPVIKYASAELKNGVLELLENENLQINKEMKEGGKMPLILAQILKKAGILPLQAVVDIHDEIFMSEVFNQKERFLNIHDVRTVLWAFWNVRKEAEIETYLKGLLTRLDASKMKTENKELIKKIITEEYLEQ